MSDQDDDDDQDEVKPGEGDAPPADGSAEPGFKLRLTKPHRLVARMLEPPPKPDQYGYTRPDHRPEIDVRVSKEQRRTALAVMDRLFKALEARDLKVETSDGGGYRDRGTYAVRGPDRAPLSIAEAYKKVEHVPTAKELREKERYSFTRIPKWDDVPTGRLTLQPGGVVDASSEAAVARLVAKAVADVEAQLDEAERRRKAEEERRNQEYLRQRAEQEEAARVTALGKAAHALHEYRLLMAYIEEVRRFGRVPDDQRREGQTLQEWLEWAESRARRMHPLG